MSVTFVWLRSSKPFGVAGTRKSFDRVNNPVSTTCATRHYINNVKMRTTHNVVYKACCTCGGLTVTARLFTCDAPLRQYLCAPL